MKTRKCKFTEIGAQPREGVFHCWSLDSFQHDGYYYQKTVGVIEDELTGEVFLIDPTNIQFIK